MHADGSQGCGCLGEEARSDQKEAQAWISGAPDFVSLHLGVALILRLCRAMIS